MTEVKFYDTVDDSLLKFAVILARSEGRWVFCKHRDRTTYEFPGGHREPGESILETARRELYEETGALDFSIRQIGVYSVQDSGGGEENFGMFYSADIRAFECELHSEIEKIWITERLPDAWTYPLIQPRLLEYYISRANTPLLVTERLILRKFEPQDAEALFEILRDEEVNTFLPMYPLESLEEAKEYLAVNYLSSYERPEGYRYAICLREDLRLVGYMNMGDGENHDFGYGMAREYWRRGIVAEAGKAVIAKMREDGVPYITATHDVHNPASGGVMKKLGMTYQYSYEEQWQPKDIRVTFRMYQLNLDGSGERVYRGYWERYPVHFVEENV